MAVTPRVLTGPIEQKSQGGVMINGSWFNYSKYPKKPYDDHEEGDTVELQLVPDKLGNWKFIATLRTLQVREPEPQPMLSKEDEEILPEAFKQQETPVQRKAIEVYTLMDMYSRLVAPAKKLDTAALKADLEALRKLTEELQ